MHLPHHADLVAAERQRWLTGSDAGQQVASMVDCAEAHRRGHLSPHAHRRHRVLTGKCDCRAVRTRRAIRHRRADTHARSRTAQQLGRRCDSLNAIAFRRPWAKRGAQHALLGDQRVDDSQRRTGEPGSCQVVIGQEWIRHRLIDAEAQQHTAQTTAAGLHRRKVAVHC